jgi:hypothetical protein
MKDADFLICILKSAPVCGEDNPNRIPNPVVRV